MMGNYDGKTRVTRTLSEDEQTTIHNEHFETKVKFAEHGRKPVKLS